MTTLTIEQITGADTHTWLERWRWAAHEHDPTWIGPMGELLWFKDGCFDEMMAYARAVMTPALAERILERQIWQMLRRSSTTIALDVQVSGGYRCAEALHFTIDHWVKGTVSTAQRVVVEGGAYTAGAIDGLWRRRVVAKMDELWQHPDWPLEGMRHDLDPRWINMSSDLPGQLIYRSGEAIASSIRGDWEERNVYASEFRRWAIEERLRCWLMARFQLRPHAEFLQAVVAEERRAEAKARELAEAVKSERPDLMRMMHGQPKNLGGGVSTIITKMF